MLGFGARGSSTYGVPPNARLLYRTRLISINGVRDPKARREDIDDEQRYQELPDGTVRNSASL